MRGAFPEDDFFMEPIKRLCRLALSLLRRQRLRKRSNARRHVDPIFNRINQYLNVTRLFLRATLPILYAASRFGVKFGELIIKRLLEYDI